MLYGCSFSIYAYVMAMHEVGFVIIYFTSRENSHNSQLGNSVSDPDHPPTLFTQVEVCCVASKQLKIKLNNCVNQCIIYLCICLLPWVLD